MKRTLSLLLVVFGTIGAYSTPFGHYLILPQDLSQQTVHAPLRERLLVYPNNLIQVPTFFDRSGLVHLKNVDPGYVGQTYPSYDANAPTQDMQPPVELKVDPVGQQPVPEERQQSDVEAIGNFGDRKMEKIEFEPDAELIPDSIPKNSPPVQPQPAVPSVPASPYPGLLPGRKFYFLNGPQFVTYPQIGAPVQPTFRYPSAIGGYPQQFLYFGQPTVQTQPGQTVFLVNDPSSQFLRSNQVQKLDVPALGFLRKSPIASYTEEQNRNVENDDAEEINTRFNPVESDEEKSEVSSKVEDKQTENKESSKSLEPVLKTATDNNDAVVIEANKNAPSKKVEIVHEDLKSTPPLAKSSPTAVAVAGEGGTAQSAPKGSAIAGPSGLAVSNPIATALAGDYDKKPTNKP